MTTTSTSCIIIGGGPAAYTAALYAARADLAPFVIEGFARGGQLMITSDVDNYPGFRDGIMGPELMEEMRAQAERFGAVYETDDVTRVEFSERPVREPHVVEVGDERHLARAVIVATGATARQLGVPGERRCRAAASRTARSATRAFFRDRRVVIVGGGDSAMEEATFLAKFATEVDDRAPPARPARLEDHAGPRPRQPQDPLGAERGRSRRCSARSEGKVIGVRVRDVDTGEVRDIAGGRRVRRHRPRPDTRRCSRACWTWTTPAT